MEHRPVRRRDGVLVEPVGDELVVYDKVSRTAHALSATAATVWRCCDGRTAASEIALRLGLARETVDQALVELDDGGLLVGSDGLSAAVVSRRQAAGRFARLAGTAFAAPLIYSIAAPPFAAAGSAAGGLGQSCHNDGDCVSGACNTVSNMCVADHCLDGHQDGNETDVDCGGGTCPGCAVGQKCLVDSDCANGACDTSTHTCAADHCVDGHRDGDETDIDCGGGTCPPCAVGQKCLVDSDCASHTCDPVALICVA